MRFLLEVLVVEMEGAWPSRSALQRPRIRAARFEAVRFQNRCMWTLRCYALSPWKNELTGPPLVCAPAGNTELRQSAICRYLPARREQLRWEPSIRNAD